MHAPHHIWPEWADRYKGAFDMGWDAYREQTLERQKQMGILPEHTTLTPVLEGVQRWHDLPEENKRLFAAWPSSTPATWSTPTPRSGGSRLAGADRAAR